MVVQGGYVSQSKGKQLNITKKPNALDKPKPNALAPKKSAKVDEDESNNNESTVDNGGSHKSPESTVTSAGRAEPEVTVSFLFHGVRNHKFLLFSSFLQSFPQINLNFPTGCRLKSNPR